MTMSQKKKKRMPAELQKFLKKHPDTQLLELLQPDMLGILRGKRVVCVMSGGNIDRATLSRILG